MTRQAENQPRQSSAQALWTSGVFNISQSTGRRLVLLTDAMAAAIAITLPWSTTLTVLFTWLYLASLLPRLTLGDLRSAFAEPISAVPTALLLLAALAMLWADAAFSERLKGLSAFRFVLAIPAALLHFRHSENAHWVLAGFLISCTALLALSWMLFLFPDIPWPSRPAGADVPVKDHITQSAEFIVCIFALAALACDAWAAKRRWYAAFLLALAGVFLANIFYVALSRTALVVLPVLLVLFGFKYFGSRGLIAILLGGTAVAALAWSSSPYLRARVVTAVQNVQEYQTNPETSVGLRLEFWRKSIELIDEAPLIGHGTGTVRELFERDAAREGRPAAIVTVNPHNQILTVALQLGLVGVALLLAMWLVHFALFNRPGFAAWIGLVIVVQNIISCMFNSHLFDFTQGLGYAWGVGVAGALVLREKAKVAREGPKVEENDRGKPGPLPAQPKANPGDLLSKES
jgi:O-antigen ligase